MNRNKQTHYPVRIIVRISQRQADDIKLIKNKTSLSDSDIVRESLEQWLPVTIHSLSSSKVVQ